MSNSSTPAQLRDRVAGQAVQPTSKAPSVIDLINRQEIEVRRALPAHMSSDRFLRLVITQLRQTPQLGQCTPQSLLGALMVSAQLGLEPGPLGQAYLIPRQNRGVWEVQFQLGYRGIIELARRSGQLASIYAMDVCDHDHFRFEYGLNHTLEHSYDLRQPRGDAYAFYGVAKFKDGGDFFLVMSREDIERRRARSAAKDRGPWQTDYVAMAKKTVIRAMAPYLPLSAEIAQAIATDETVRRQEVATNMTETYVAPDDPDDEPAVAEIVEGPGYAPGEEPFDAEPTEPAK